MKARLLYVVGQLGAGGSERQLVYLLSTMDREVFRPAVAVWRFNENDTFVPEIRRLGVPIVGLDGTQSVVAKVSALRAVVRSCGAEVVHSYSFYTNSMTDVACRGAGAVPIGSVRGDFTHRARLVGPLLARVSARWPRVQIANSYVGRANGLAAGRYFSPRELPVVINGLDLAGYAATPPPVDEPITILGVGSLYPVKRWDRFLAIIGTLRERGHDFRAQIAGGGPLREELQQAIDGMGLRGIVELLGHRSDIAELLQRSALLLHTSESEGCPNVVMEAMASGRPVVATAVGDTARLVRHSESGFVAAATDVAGLANLAGRLVADEHLRRRMGQAARNIAERDFCLGRLLEETFAVYRSAGWRSQ